MVSMAAPCGRVHDDVDRHLTARDRGSGGPDVCTQHPVFINAHHDDAGRDFVADHRADSARPIAGLSHRLEDRAEQREACPPEEVGELLVAPVPPALA